MELDQRYQRNESFVFRKIEDETILVPIKNNVGDMGCIYNLNSVGAFIWEHLDGDHTLRDIKNKLLEAFDVSSPIAETDLSEFVDQLEEIDAVYRVD